MLETAQPYALARGLLGNRLLVLTRSFRRLQTAVGRNICGSQAGRLSRILLRNDQQFFVADLDGRTVGWVHVVLAEYVDAEAFAVIGGLVVDRNHRRLGIGRELMDRAEVGTRERGCSIVRLASSSTRNAAHRFYEDLGYTNIKTQYSFIKPLDPTAAARVRAFIPRVDPAS